MAVSSNVIRICEPQFFFDTDPTKLLKTFFEHILQISQTAGDYFLRALEPVFDELDVLEEDSLLALKTGNAAEITNVAKWPRSYAKRIQ